MNPAPLARILMVDDEAPNMRALCDTLRDHNYEIEGFTNGEEALEALRDRPFDLLLTDLMMPGIDGVELLAAALNIDPHIVGILMTGKGTIETAVQAMQTGALDYVLKPLKVSAILPVLARALEIRRLRNENADLHRRVEAEAELRRVEGRFRTLVESIPDALVVSNLEGRILLLNAQAEVQFGYARHELIGRAIETLVPPLARESHVASRAEYIAAHHVRAMGSGRILHALRKDGTEVPVEITLSPVEMADGPAVIAIARDVTERRQLEAQVRQLQKLEGIGQLAGGIAHDFNNLLTVITGRCQLLLARSEVDDRSRRDLELIQKTAMRAVALTKQILAFSRKQILEPQILDLNSVVAGMTEMLHRLIGEHIDLVFNPGSDLGRVLVDPGQIEQVIMNLAVNARDAMPEGGSLTLETNSVELGAPYALEHVGVTPGNYVMLAVSDTGCGMDAATQARIFEPFFTTKEPGRGTGLGLATLYGVVKQHGGNIWVYSEPGHGTTFKVYLPHAPHTVPTAEGPKAPRVRPGHGTETVLLVEDEDEIRRLARELLTEYGYTVFEARDGSEALLIAERHTGPIHLLLTDVIMPRMNGRALAERLAPLRPEMKVLYMSGYTDTAIVHHGRLDAETEFIPKPFMPEDLALKVRSALDAPE